jgi:hypothetical protein
MKGVNSCEGDELYLSKGYWRRYATSETVLACLLDARSCPGGSAVGEAFCGVGYEGPLCAICLDGYFLNNNKCLQCTSGNQLTPTSISFLVVVFMILVLAATIYYKEQVALQKQEVETAKCENNEKVVASLQSNSKLLSIYRMLKLKYDQIVVKAKILVSTYQVISSTANVFAISFPYSFSILLNGLKIFNVTITSFIPIGCRGHYNYALAVVWITIAPILASCLLFVGFLLEFAMVRRTIQSNPNRQKGMKKKAFREMKSKYLNYFFYLTYFVLPSVTTTLFQWFLCTNVDPQNEDDAEYDLYLTADMSIACQSPYYHHWTLYVVLMIILYPVGVPSLYLYLLHSCKHEIATREESSDKEENKNGQSYRRSVSTSQNESFAKQQLHAISTNVVELSRDRASKLSASALRLKFLWKAYRPEFWYWEVIETTRKLMLTAVLSVCSPGSSQQAVLGVLMSYGYIRLYGYCSPYDEEAENVLAETGQMQILFTFFVTMVLQQNMLGDAWNTTLGAFLTVFNLTLIFLVLYYEVVNYRVMVKEDLEQAALRKEIERKKRSVSRLLFAQQAGKSLDEEKGLQFQKVENMTFLKRQEEKFDIDLEVDSDDEDNEVVTTINAMHAPNLSSFGQIEMQVVSPQPANNIKVDVDSDDED